jgi:hypothetical protein
MARILGLGLDPGDGHLRRTLGEGFEVYQGSEASHDEMRSLCQKIIDRIETQGKRLQDLSQEEFASLLRELE